MSQLLERDTQAIGSKGSEAGLRSKIIKSDLPCSCCGGDAVRVLFPAGVAQENQIVRCEQCEFMFVSPQPVTYGTSRPDPEKGYEVLPNYSDADYQKLIGDYMFQQRVAKERGQVVDYMDTFDILDKQFPNRGKVLEIGAGFGFLLEEFSRRGWDALGLDLDGAVVRYAREELGLNLVHAHFESSGQADRDFEVVVSNHVVEHVYDPLDFMTKIYRVLKPEGYLVLETPRYDSLAFKLLGRRERSLTHNGHLSFFTGPTMTKLAERAGYKVVRIDSVGRTLNAYRLVWNLGKVSKSKAVASAMERFARAANFERLKFKLHMNDIMRVYLQRPAD